MKTLNKNKRSHFLKKFWIILRMWVGKIFKLRAGPHQIALGFAIGMFLGIFPTFGLAIILITLLALIIKFNVPASILGTFIANPFLGPFWIFVSYKTGKFIANLFGIKIEKSIDDSIFKKIFHFGHEYLLGNIAVALLSAIIGYLVLLFLVTLYEKKKKERRLHHNLKEIPKNKDK